MKIELHNISRCGFYERGQSGAPIFGGLTSWCQEFVNWVQGRESVSLTTTFQSQDAENPATYCIGAIRRKSGFGLIFWHGVPSTEKGIAYISMDAAPGSVNAQEARLASGAIPGWPSYCWILPQKNKLVTIQPTGKIRNRTTGLSECREYFQGWLRSSSSYVHRISRADTHDGAEIELAWRSGKDKQARTDLFIHFDTHPITSPCVLDEIRQRCQEIRKLVHSVQIKRVLPTDRTKLIRLMALMGFDQFSSRGTDRLAFRWEIDWQPDLLELEALISRQQSESERNHKERQAVRFKGDSSLYWLDGGPVRGEVILPDELERALHWSPQQLAQAWAAASKLVDEWCANAN